jgi:polyhydroxybutyrate depolymerase
MASADRDIDLGNVVDKLEMSHQDSLPSHRFDLMLVNWCGTGRTDSRRAVSPATLIFLTIPALSPHLLPPGDHAREFRIGDQVRSYQVHVPTSYDARKPTSVILVFHSAMMNGTTMARYCGLSEKADQCGFVVVYANGTGSTPLFLYWDAGGVRGRISDDVSYVARLLDDLDKIVNVDPKRIFATGMSNGAMMCYRLAAELSDRIAAIAPVAGTMAIENCQPHRPVPVIHFHGTKDGIVLYGGSDERTPKNLKFNSVDDSIRTWVKLNGCPPSPTVIDLPDRADDGTTVRRERYGPGKGDSEVILYIIKGGGHTWPGGESRVPLLGKTTREISANDLIWEFFQHHPLK